jgi:uncharacterized protein (TIGR02391 family)
MPIEELAVRFLRFLRAKESEAGSLEIRSWARPESLEGYIPDEAGHGARIEMSRRLSEAWSRLQTTLCIARDLTQGEPWCFVTDRSRALVDQAPDQRTFEAEVYLPRGLLKPRLKQESRPLFLRGAYDTAVFTAMRAVEIERAAGLYGPETFGVDLMRKAFHPENGPLRDEELPRAERHGLSDLFAGAIALFKNPSSHREVNLMDPLEVANILRFADALHPTSASAAKAASNSPDARRMVISSLGQMMCAVHGPGRHPNMASALRSTPGSSSSTRPARARVSKETPPM